MSSWKSPSPALLVRIPRRAPDIDWSYQSKPLSLGLVSGILRDSWMIGGGAIRPPGLGIGTGALNPPDCGIEGGALKSGIGWTGWGGAKVLPPLPSSRRLSIVTLMTTFAMYGR